jgi:hypothetical protein
MTRSLTDSLDSVVNARRDPMERLARLLATEQWVREAEREAALDAIIAGHSWTEIGALVGTSRQAAWERWGREESPRRGWTPVAGPGMKSPRPRRRTRADRLYGDPWSGPVTDEDDE